MTNAEQTRDVTYHIIEDNEETETLTANGPEGTYVCGVFSSLQGEDYALYSNPELTEAYDYSFPTGDKDVYVVF